MVSQTPLISVIMGAYNCESTIRQAVESVIAQTYANWEFIICDDCSTDGTLGILREYERRDSRFKILHNESNKRLAASLNTCLSIASGKYIARMDADDECLPERFFVQVNFLEKHPEIDAVGCAIALFDSKGVFGNRFLAENPMGPETWSTTPFAHPTIVMKKSVYDSLNGYNVSIETMRAEDLDLWFRFYEKGFKGHNLSKILYKYREGIADYKKRTLKAAFLTSKLRFKWHRKLKLSWKSSFFILKPILSALFPNKLMMFYHTKKMGR